MSDDVDATNDRIEKETALFVSDAVRKAAMIPAGQPGECYYCGESFARVVMVASVGELVCGCCRDRRRLE